MPKIVSLLREYPLVSLTLAVGLLALLLTFAIPVAVTSVIGHWMVVAWCAFIAAKSLWSMIQELRGGSFGLDILAVTAIVSTLVVGEYWASLVIVLMVTSGEALEDYAANRAKQDLTSLVSNAPQHARRLGPNGEMTTIPVDQVQIGDQLVVRAHEVVPVDGILHSPNGAFDESSLTGEALPRDLAHGDDVLSGSICGSNSVTIKATKAAAESQYQQIVSLVESAAASKAPMVRMADRYAIPFTALSFAIAGVAWFISGDPLRFAQVLVVATPCPLLIGAPVAFMAGMSRAARRGIIIKSSATLEKLSSAKSFAFDKTGTLTHGKPEVTRLAPAGEFSEADLLTYAASAEQGSAHILAEALVDGANTRGLTLSMPAMADEETGGGVRAQVNGRAVVVGKRTYVEKAVNVAPKELSLAAGELSVFVGVDGQYAGAVVLRDQLRTEATNTIRSLEAHGIHSISMFTGDEKATAEYIGKSVGIQNVFANQLPADKLNGVHAIQPRPVVMVGDGVNDAPVLAAADVGIAMAARGSTSASESADVVILPDDLGRVSEAHQVGIDTIRVAKQSIWLGIIISVGLMLFAATGALPAIIGAWLQEAVDVISILWALRAGGKFLSRRRGLDHYRVFTGPGQPPKMAPTAVG